MDVSGAFYAPYPEREIEFCTLNRPHPWTRFADTPTPHRAIYDQARDADPWRKRLARRGSELIGPPRKSRVKPPLQDGRKLRRDKRRWKGERTFAWLGHFRRLVVRWERHITLYQGFFHVARLLITLRQL
jgi:transposase